MYTQGIPECPVCGTSKYITVNGDDTGADWWECAKCGHTDFRLPPRPAIREARREHYKKMHLMGKKSDGGTSYEDKNTGG